MEVLKAHGSEMGGELFDDQISLAGRLSTSQYLRSGPQRLDSDVVDLLKSDESVTP